MAGAKEYFRVGRERLDFLRDQKSQLASSLQAYQKDAKRLDDLHERTWRDLIGYLLPDVDDEELTALEQRLAYPMLLGIKEEHEGKLRQALARREELARLDEVAHHDILVARIDDELEEIRPAYADARESLPAWEGSRWFMALDSRGYFDDAYEPGLWDRVRDWRAISLLMAEVEKQGEERLSSAGAARDRYRGLREDWRVVQGSWDALQERRATCVRLEKEHADLQDAPQRFMESLYRDLGRSIRDHLEACPVPFRFELSRGDRDLDSFFRKLAGLGKQVQYLRELSTVRIQKHIDGLERQIRKLQSKLDKRNNKYRRGRFHGVPDHELDGLRNFKADKWARRHAKLDKLRRRITDFDRYDDGSYGEHYLWWDVLTRGAPADDLYEVRTFREQWGPDVTQHPHARLEAELHPEHEVDALAAADSLAEDMATSAEDWSGLDDVS